MTPMKLLYPNLHSQCNHPLHQSNSSHTMPQFDYTIAPKMDRKIVTLNSEAMSCLSSK